MAKNLGLFVDVSNLYYCIYHTFGKRKLNYRKYLHECVGQHRLIGAYAYGAKINKEADKFISNLIEYGYTPKYKTPKMFQGSNIMKANWDIGIAMDVVRMITSHSNSNSNMDIVILGSGDGDYAPLVQWVREQGKECHIFATRISYELKSIANSWREITEDLLEPYYGKRSA